MCATRSCTTSTWSRASRPRARVSSRTSPRFRRNAVTIFSAHGVAKSVEEEAAARDLPVLNATCPLVTKVHNQGKRYVGQGRRLILIGHAGHPEVEGTMGQIAEPVTLVQTESDVATLDIPADTPVAYVTQTTLSVDDTRGIIAALHSRFTDIVGPETRDICYATQNRQTAVRELSKLVDVILVVGAKNSSNSNRLREIGEEAGMPSYLIADGSELDPDWFARRQDRRHHRRRFGAGSAGRGRHRRAAPARSGRGQRADRPPGNHRVPLAAGTHRWRNGQPGDGESLISGAPPNARTKAKKEKIVGVSLRQKAVVGSYVLRQRLAGRKRYPLVLMLEPLFRCNLACVGCGKIDYPDAILNKRLSVQECLDAVDECGAPMVAIPGGEPLIHKEIGEIVKGIVARKKFVSLCTNALLLEKKLHLFEPSPYLFFSVHLDGLKEHHDKSVCMEGGFEKAVAAIKAAKAKGFAVNVNCTIFDGHPAEDIAAFLDLTEQLGVGVSISPGYAYERAPDQEHFLSRAQDQGAVPQRLCARQGQEVEPHAFQHVPRLPRRQPGIPLHAVGHADAQYLRLAEAVLSARRRLCQDVHGIDGDHRLGRLRHRPLRKMRQLHGALRLRADRGRRHDEASAQGAGGRLAWRQDRRPDGAGNPMANQRPAQYVFDGQVQQRLSEIRAAEAREKAPKAASAA